MLLRSFYFALLSISIDIGRARLLLIIKLNRKAHNDLWQINRSITPFTFTIQNKYPSSTPCSRNKRVPVERIRIANDILSKARTLPLLYKYNASLKTMRILKCINVGKIYITLTWIYYSFRPAMAYTGEYLKKKKSRLWLAL